MEPARRRPRASGRGPHCSPSCGRTAGCRRISRTQWRGAGRKACARRCSRMRRPAMGWAFTRPVASAGRGWRSTANAQRLSDSRCDRPDSRGSLFRAADSELEFAGRRGAAALDCAPDHGETLMATQTLGGNLAGNNAQVLMDVADTTAISATVTGTFSATITFQVLYDTTEGWVAAPCFTRAGVSTTNTLTAAGNRFIDVKGAVAVRALMTPYTSGNAECTFAGSPAAPVTAGGGGGGGAVTVADGADVAEGATTDARVVGDNPGTVSAKLRGANYVAGDQADAAASTDTGTFSMVALFKRLLQKFTAGLFVQGMAAA